MASRDNAAKSFRIAQKAQVTEVKPRSAGILPAVGKRGETILLHLDYLPKMRAQCGRSPSHRFSVATRFAPGGDVGFAHASKHPSVSTGLAGSHPQAPQRER